MRCKKIHKLENDHFNDTGRCLIDGERVRLGQLMVSKWTEERWVREIPLQWRMSRVYTASSEKPEDRAAAARTSYEVMRDVLLRQLDVHKNCAYLEPSVFWLAADRYDVGIFIIHYYPEADSTVTHYWHIRPKSKQHIVIRFAHSHFEAVEYGGIRKKRMFPTDDPFVQHLKKLCTTHSAGKYHEEDLDQRIVLERQSLLAVPDADQPTAAAPSTPAKQPSVVEQQPAVLRRSTRPRFAVTAQPASVTSSVRKAHSSGKPTAPSRQSSQKGGKRVAPVAPAAGGQRRPAPNQPPAVRPAASSVPVAGAPLQPAAIAAHGQLYDYISFPNVPQWVAMCTIPFNAYRLASQGNDRAAQDVAVQDILMLPQRVLTRMGRGPGDGRRLNRVVRARCFSHSQLLRKRYDRQPPQDDHVRLDEIVETAPLVHRVAEEPSAAEASAGMSGAVAGVQQPATAPVSGSAPCPPGESAIGR